MQAHDAARCIVRIDDGFDGRTAFDLFQRRFDLLMAVTRNDDDPVRTQVDSGFPGVAAAGIYRRTATGISAGPRQRPPDGFRGLRRGLLLS